MSRDSIPDIKSYRRTVGLRISDLAEMTGVSASLLKQWERGIAVPKVHELRVLAELMGCDAHALATRQEALSKNAVTGEGYVTRRTENLSCLRRSVAPGEDRIKVLDLFCGSGGFSYGFEQSGAFAVTAGIDLLMDRADTYSANHPTADTITADIRAFSIDELSAHALEPEVVIGGPPCQGFSSIRPFRDRGRGDSRNNLFEEFALVVEALRPRWFVLENVVGLLTHGSGATLKALLAAFAELGYTVDWRIIDRKSVV